MSELFSLAGRVALVTGGSGTIGLALARGLAEAGATVGVLGRDATRLQGAVAQLEQAGHAAIALQADVTRAAELENARAELIDRTGRIDVLVNCAGGNVEAAILADDRSPFEVGDDAYREVIELNVLGTVLPTRVFGSAMGDGGSIVNVSSMAASRALTRVGAYGLAKAAVESLTRSLAVELARRGTGIRVNAVAPGFVLGEQNRRLLLREDGSPTERAATIVARTPLGRFGQPEELVSTVVWLAAPGSRFVTGVVVPVDGGFSAFSGV